MRNLILCFFILNFSSAFAQNLKNTEWVKIGAEREDGSKIVGRDRRDLGVIKYQFLNDSVRFLVGGRYLLTEQFSVDSGILSIGNFQRFRIDTVNNAVLGITDLPVHGQLPDQLNSYGFIKSRYLFEYLQQAGKVIMLGDSLIQCNNQLSPVYSKGDMDPLFSGNFQRHGYRRTLSGYFIIGEDDQVKRIVLNPSVQFKEGEVENFKNTLLSTGGSWVLPVTDPPFQFKIDFTCTTWSDKYVTTTSLQLHPNDTISGLQILTLEEEGRADNYFNRGMDFFDKGKFEKASAEFAKCLEVDSLYLDAYYDKAYSDLKRGNKGSACGIWKKLSDMDQKPAEELYLKNCQ